MPIELDPLSERLLLAFVAQAAELHRANVNGLTIARRMNLEYRDYEGAVERLMATGCVTSDTGMLTSIVITPVGFAVAERMQRD